MSRHTYKTLYLTIISILLVGIFLTGCTSTKPATIKSTGDTTTKAPETASTPSSTATPSDSTEQSVKMTLYFPNADASGLIATERTVVVKDLEMIKTMFIELANPPSGLEKPLPLGTELLGATVDSDGIATIDLSSEFQKNFGGGSAGEQMTMYSIVNTITALSNVHSVQFLLEGKKLDGIIGNLDTSTPLKPNEGLIIK